MYEIYTHNHKDAKVTVHIDGRNPTAVPPAVSIGIGNKKSRYAAWLDKAISDENKKQLLNFLVYLNKIGKEKGSLYLKCECRFDKFHAQVVKDFLIKNKETLDVLQPYLYPAEGEASSEAEAPVRGNTGSAEEMIARGVITQADMDFFIHSMNEEQNKQVTE